MIEIEKLRQRFEVLETLMHAKLGVRGKDLSTRFRRAGRRLPKRVRKAGRTISEAERTASHPKLARLHDPKALDAAFSEVVNHLNGIDPTDRRRGIALGVLGGLVFNLILLVAAVLTLMYWQGLV